MKRSILVMGLLFAGSTAWSVIVSDDFNRADTTYSTNGADIGANWVNPNEDLWRINGDKLQTDLISSPSHLYNTAQQLTGSSFTMSMDVTSDLIGKYSGVVFNYQDSLNYYTLRIKSGDKAIHLLSVVNGVNDTVLLQNAPANFVVGTLSRGHQRAG